MTMKFSLNVVDVQGAKQPVVRGPLKTATVTLLTEAEANNKIQAVAAVPRKERFRQLTFAGLAATHKHTKDGVYDSATSFAAGNYLLVVTADKKSPTIQRLTLSERNGVTVVKPGWAGKQPTEANLRASNVEFPDGAQGKGARQAQRSLLTVKAVPQVEFVLFSGTGYWHLVTVNGRKVHDGTRWNSFALEHRRPYWSEKAADRQMIGGYLVTIFNCEDCHRRTYVKALGNEDTWMLAEEVKTDATRSFQDDGRPSDDIGILDLYRYLDAVGRERKNSVWEVSIFSHSWFGGPILWDTWQHRAYQALPTRDPDDLDARVKDWGPAVLGGFPALRNAHLFKAVWKIKGCNAQGEARAGIVAVQKQLKPAFDRNALFNYDYREESERTDPASGAKRKSVELHHHQLSLAHFLRELAENIRGTYSGHVPAGVGLTVGCYAAAPGFGSSMPDKNQPGKPELFITKKQTVIDGNPTLGSPPDSDSDKTARPLFDFYRRELGSAYPYLVDNRGYFEHRFLLEEAAKWPTPVWTTARYRTRDIIRNDGGQLGYIFRVASGARIKSMGANALKLDTVTAENGLVVAGQQGHLFAGKLGRCKDVVRNGATTYVHLEPDTGRDWAVFMQEDGTLYAMRRTGSAAWVVDTSPIPLQQNGTDMSPITNGILEHVTPGFIW
jgi:hypothetical protein